MASWYVYVLRARRPDGRVVYYTGATNDPDRRLRQHNGELVGGARFTRSYRPWERIALYGPFDGRGEAQRVERQIKKLPASAKASYPEVPLVPVPTYPLTAGVVPTLDGKHGVAHGRDHL